MDIRDLARGGLICLLFLFMVRAELQAREFFLDQLEEQYRVVVNSAHKSMESMDDSSYKDFLMQEMSASLNQKRPLVVSVLIDVTDESQVYFDGVLSSSRQASKSAGISIIKEIIKSSRNHDLNTRSNESTAAFEEQWKADSAISVGLTALSPESKIFDQVNIVMGSKALEATASSSKVSDVMVIEGPNFFSRIHTETGRFYREVDRPEYQAQFIKDGFYKELKDAFAAEETVLVNLTLVGLEEYTQNPTPENEALGIQKIHDVLNSIEGENIEIVNFGAYDAVLLADEDVVDKLYFDSRVRTVQDRIFNGSRIRMNR